MNLKHIILITVKIVYCIAGALSFEMPLQNSLHIKNPFHIENCKHIWNGKHDNDDADNEIQVISRKKKMEDVRSTEWREKRRTKNKILSHQAPN